jgi:hypothetical protein
MDWMRACLLNAFSGRKTRFSTMCVFVAAGFGDAVFPRTDVDLGMEGTWNDKLRNAHDVAP